MSHSLELFFSFNVITILLFWTVRNFLLHISVTVWLISGSFRFSIWVRISLWDRITLWGQNNFMIWWCILFIVWRKISFVQEIEAFLQSLQCLHFCSHCSCDLQSSSLNSALSLVSVGIEQLKQIFLNLKICKWAHI